MVVRPTYSINPDDIGQAKGLGINILFNNGTNVFNQTFTTKEKVKSNLIHFILTNKGERIFDPEFGGNIRAALFEPDTIFEQLEASLEQEIYAHVPNITVKNITIKKLSDKNLVNLAINYSINEQGDSLNINISTQDITQ